MKVILVIAVLMLAGCTTDTPLVSNTPQGIASIPAASLMINTADTPCHGDLLPPGSCPNSAVKDMDGTACHHTFNCGGH